MRGSVSPPLIVLINSDPGQAGRDRNTLSKLSFTALRQFSSLNEARASLMENPPEIILLGERAGSQSGMDALRAIKRDPALKSRAVVMISSDGRRESVLAAVSAGCCGYVLRPYPARTFARHLRTALSTTRPDEKTRARVEHGLTLAWMGRYSEAVEELEQATAQENKALEWFNKGLEHLRRQEYGQAIQAFNRSLALNTLFAEAYRGLAYAHQGLGEQEKHLENLKKSADILAMQDKLQELKELYVEILSHDPEAVNPYNTLGVRLRRSGDLSGALHAYTRALDLTPSDENLHYNIAKAYMHAARKDQARNHLRQALAIRPDFAEATRMLEELGPDEA